MNDNQPGKVYNLLMNIFFYEYSFTCLIMKNKNIPKLLKMKNNLH